MSHKNHAFFSLLDERLLVGLDVKTGFLKEAKSFPEGRNKAKRADEHKAFGAFLESTPC